MKILEAALSLYTYEKNRGGRGICRAKKCERRNRKGWRNLKLKNTMSLTETMRYFHIHLRSNTKPRNKHVCTACVPMFSSHVYPFFSVLVFLFILSVDVEGYTALLHTDPGFLDKSPRVQHELVVEFPFH